MNTLVAKDTLHEVPAHPAVGLVRFTWSALGSITWRELAWFLFISLLVVGMNFAWSVEGLLMGKKIDLLLPVVLPLAAFPFGVCTWAIADRARSGWPRPLRLAIGVMAGAALVAVCVPPIVGALGFDLSKEMTIDGKPGLRVPMWAYCISGFFDVCFFNGIGVAVLETYRRRTARQRTLEAARQEQARLARELLESRLAAMQAQVEPHFLFDSLVDVQATYDRDAEHGATVMDRLITYLRVALPRLREQGSTVQAEADLVAAYLAVVAARHGGRPAVNFDIAPACANARFSPMLLLPLVQRSVRDASRDGDVPQRVGLAVSGDPKTLTARLRIESPGLCRDDPELARVRDRLAGLYDGRARLECAEPQPGVSEFTLCVPR